MFYVLSKLLFFAIQPINWVFGTFLYSFFCKKAERKRRSFILGLVLFFFFTNHFIFNQVVRFWEPEPVHYSDLETYDIGILAGGYSNFFIENGNGLYHYNQRAARVIQAVQLFHKGVFKQILLTGGSGYMFGQEPSEAIEARALLINLGIPDSCIITEYESRTTHENAVYTAALLQKMDASKASCLLITSAFHAPRTAACFRKEGMDFDVFCVDYIGEKTRFVPESLLIPDRLGFYNWERLTKEWVGLVMYWMKGYV